MISPDNKLCYLAIPKNSSSFITKHLETLHWKTTSSDPDCNVTTFIVLRNPFQRYISGLVEDIENYISDFELSSKVRQEILSDDDWFLRWIFTTKTFEVGWHTRLQVSFMTSNLPGETVYFQQENNLNFKLHHFLLGEGIKNNFLHLPKEHVKNDFPTYKQIEKFLSDGKNIKYKEALVKYLKPDYDFINSVTFY